MSPVFIIAVTTLDETVTPAEEVRPPLLSIEAPTPADALAASIFVVDEIGADAFNAAVLGEEEA